MKFTKQTPKEPGFYLWRVSNEVPITCFKRVAKSIGGDIYNADSLEDLPKTGEWCRLIPEDEANKTKEVA